jgi:hypothetical protein
MTEKIFYLSVIKILLPFLIFAEGITADVTPASGIDVNDGAIDLHVSGGFSPYSYEWKDEAGNIIATTEDINGLLPSDYCVVVTDALCGIAELCIEVPVNCPEINIPNPQIREPSDCSSNDGSIYFRFGGPYGGVPPYTWEWSNGNNSGYNNNLGVGTYYLTITDFNGCTVKSSYELNGVGAPEIYNIVEPACIGYKGGIIELLVISFVPDPEFTFSWNNGYTTDILENLPAGIYCVTVTETISGCANQECFEVLETIESNGIPIVEAEIINTCQNENTGSIQLSIEGGNPPYSLNWSITSESEGFLIDDLSQGIYCVTVTDDCDQYNYCYEVIVSPPLSISIINMIDACQGNDGTITIQVNGEVKPYTYAWEGLNTGINGKSGNSHSTTNTITGLTADSYSITITDAIGCEQILIVNIGGIQIGTQIQPACVGWEIYQGGSLILTASGGVGPYTYTWPTWVTTENTNVLSDLYPGNYLVTITDVNGCFLKAKITVPNSILYNGEFFTNYALWDEELTYCYETEICPNGEEGFGGPLPVGYFPLNSDQPCVAGTFFCAGNLRTEYAVADGILTIGDIIAENPFAGTCVLKATCTFNNIFHEPVITSTSLIVECECVEFIFSEERYVFFGGGTTSPCGSNCCKVKTVFCALTGTIYHQTFEPALLEYCFALNSPDDQENLMIPKNITYYNNFEDQILVKVFPIPFSNFLNIEVDNLLAKKYPLSVLIQDLFGKKIIEKEEILMPGKNVIKIESENKLTSGIYSMLLRDFLGNQIVKKIMYLEN